ncbi:6176_t:CDS:1, partial [Racocetra persica]
FDNNKLRWEIFFSETVVFLGVILLVKCNTLFSNFVPKLPIRKLSNSLATKKIAKQCK